MKKRFIVLLDSETREQNKKFKSYIKEDKYNWWHWLNNSWLVIDESGELTAAKLRTDLADFFPGVHKLVIELKDKNDTWAGYGPSTEDENMFKWLKKNW